MHHSSQRDEEMTRKMREAVPEGTYSPKLGATGRFPEGKLTEHDEGEIMVAVGHTNRKVVIDFGQEVTWMGMDAKQARDLALALMSHARRIS